VKTAGAVTLNYGVFINSVVAFLFVPLAMFGVMRLVNRLDEALDDDDAKPEDPTSKKCPLCKETVAYRATRCAHCTSDLEPVADAAS
jgi:large conductance mechanosensitive channel